MENTAVLPAFDFELPESVRPIDVIGAGGIVTAAHLPAYLSVGLTVRGIFDLNVERAREVAGAFGIPCVYRSLQDVEPGGVYDVAIPASAFLDVLGQLPKRAAILLQKPFGENLAQAEMLLAMAREKEFLTAVNFQLRYSPAVRLARALIDSGRIGDLHDLEVRVNVHTPWEQWDFLESAPDVEILYHSIHYLDLIRSFWGEPERVHCFSGRHPDAPKLKATRSVIALDYGPDRRAVITTYHGHRWGIKHQESYVKWEGTRGAIRATLGVLQDYPRGLPDRFEIATREHDWQEIPVQGRWFPDAFAGPMLDLQRAVDHPAHHAATHFEDALCTMALVDACHRDHAVGGTSPSRIRA